MQNKNNSTSNIRTRSRGLPQPILGGGFSTDKQMAAEINCFAPGNVTYVGESKVTISFNNSISFSQVQTILNVDVSSSLSIGMFSGGISESYAQYIQKTRYTNSLHYLVNISLPFEQFQPLSSGVAALNEIGRDVYSGGPAQFRNACGDQLIEGVNLGALLLVTILIKFSSNYDSETFAQHASVSWGSIFSATATIKQVVATYNLQGSIEVVALQSGGDPTQLARIFSHCPTHYCIATCALNDIDACNGVITGVVHYGEAVFPQQVGFGNHTVNGSASPLSYIMTNTSTLGLNVGPSVLNATILDAREKLGDIYTAMNTNSTFVKHLLASQYAPYMFSDTINRLRVNNNALDANLALLDDGSTGAIDCYYHPTNCPATASALIPQLQSIDTTFINAMNRGFIINGQESGCRCSPCAGSTINLNGYLFPADAISNVYFITTNLHLQIILIFTNTTVALTNVGTQCPTGYNSPSNHNLYEFDACDCVDYCLGGICMSVLGATSTSHGCSSNFCTGAMSMLFADNPL